MIVCSLTGFAPIAKYFHGFVLIAFVLGIAAAVVLAMVWLRRWHLRAPRQRHHAWLIALWIGFALLFAVFFPISQRHILGPGSDRADALRVSGSALIHGRYPYYTSTYLGNDITPLPGAILLALPFFLLGNVAFQNLFWLAAFIAFACWFFCDRATAFIFVLLLLGTSAVNLDDFVVGGDLLVNAMYICIALACVIATHEQKSSLWSQLVSAVFLGLAIDSRPVYIVVFPLTFAYLCQHGGAKQAIRALLVSAGAATLWSVPFYLHSPAHFTPLHLRDKLDFIPPQYHAAVLLPTLGVLISCAACFMRLSQQRLFLMLGASLFIMIGAPGLIQWFQSTGSPGAWQALGWLSLPSFYFSLWLFAKYQRTGYRLRP